MNGNNEKQYVYNGEEGKALLFLARSTLMDRLKIQDHFPGHEVMAEKLSAPCFQYRLGNFVTLKKNDMLRGCIGNLQSTEPLVEGIKGNAINAAFHDSRFSPLTAHEFSVLTIDISVLTPPSPLEFDGVDNLLHKLQRGVDGVVLQHGIAGATFLPQVWEQLPSPKDFLSQLCRKAGLSSVAWQTDSIEILTYQAQHFIE